MVGGGAVALSPEAPIPSLPEPSWLKHSGSPHGLYRNMPNGQHDLGAEGGMGAGKGKDCGWGGQGYARVHTGCLEEARWLKDCEVGLWGSGC